jgi:hypothetical protein
MIKHAPGPLTGLIGEEYDWIVRKARKAHHCRWCYSPTRTADGRLHVPPHKIKAGELYVQGDVDPYEAGGYGHERICLGCIDKWEEQEQSRRKLS